MTFVNAKRLHEHYTATNQERRAKELEAKYPELAPKPKVVPKKETSKKSDN